MCGKGVTNDSSIDIEAPAEKEMEKIIRECGSLLIFPMTKTGEHYDIVKDEDLLLMLRKEMWRQLF